MINEIAEFCIVESNETCIVKVDEKVIDNAAESLQVTRFTARTPDRLSKAFRLDGGRLVKESGGQLFDGTAEQITTDITGFAELLTTLTPRQALAYGVSDYSAARVVPARNLPAQPSKEPTIARDRHHSRAAVRPATQPCPSHRPRAGGEFRVPARIAGAKKPGCCPA